MVLFTNQGVWGSESEGRGDTNRVPVGAPPQSNGTRIAEVDTPLGAVEDEEWDWVGGCVHKLCRRADKKERVVEEEFVFRFMVHGVVDGVDINISANHI